MKRPETPPDHEVVFWNTTDAMELTKVNKRQDFERLLKNEYPYWEELKYKVKNWGISPERIWDMIKRNRIHNRQDILLSRVDGFGFSFTIPVFLQKDLHELDMNMGGILQSESLIPSEDKSRYLISSLMEEAIASSQLEGAVTTRKVAREMLEKNKKPKTESERMILNNYEVMRWLVGNHSEKLTPDVLLKIHSLITKDTLKDKRDEGNFRDSDDVTVNEEITNEVFYVPPSYKYVPQLINDFCNFVNDDETIFIHPVIKGVILHFLIGYIHPFADGNGRTARAVFYYYLMRKGYWLVEYMSISRVILKAKAQYARAYLHTEYDDNDLTYFVLYNIKAIKTALADLKSYIQKKIQEKKNTIALLKNIDFNDRQVVLVKDILDDRNQHFTVKQVELKFNISNQTARTDLADLVKKKILTEKKSGKKSQFFAADNLEKTLNIK